MIAHITIKKKKIVYVINKNYIKNLLPEEPASCQE